MGQLVFQNCAPGDSQTAVQVQFTLRFRRALEIQFTAGGIDCRLNVYSIGRNSGSAALGGHVALKGHGAAADLDRGRSSRIAFAARGGQVAAKGHGAAGDFDGGADADISDHSIALNDQLTASDLDRRTGAAVQLAAAHIQRDRLIRIKHKALFYDTLVIFACRFGYQRQLRLVLKGFVQIIIQVTVCTFQNRLKLAVAASAVLIPFFVLFRSIVRFPVADCAAVDVLLAVVRRHVVYAMPDPIILVPAGAFLIVTICAVRLVANSKFIICASLCCPYEAAVRAFLFMHAFSDAFVSSIIMAAVLDGKTASFQIFK